MVWGLPVEADKRKWLGTSATPDDSVIGIHNEYGKTARDKPGAATLSRRQEPTDSRRL